MRQSRKFGQPFFNINFKWFNRSLLTFNHDDRDLISSHDDDHKSNQWWPVRRFVRLNMSSWTWWFWVDRIALFFANLCLQELIHKLPICDAKITIENVCDIDGRIRRGFIACAHFVITEPDPFGVSLLGAALTAIISAVGISTIAGLAGPSAIRVAIIIY